MVIQILQNRQFSKELNITDNQEFSYFVVLMHCVSYHVARHVLFVLLWLGICMLYGFVPCRVWFCCVGRAKSQCRTLKPKYLFQLRYLHFLQLFNRLL